MQEKLIALQTQTVVLLIKATWVLHNWLREASAASFSYYKGMDEIDVRVESKRYVAFGDKR
jgi:hypothetical protein